MSGPIRARWGGLRLSNIRGITIMRSLLIREFHQGSSLLAFSALLGILVPAGYVALSHTSPYRLYAVGQSELAAIFGKLILLLPLVVALFAGAGLFAAERDRGTLPVLFALPFSRRRIWLAKALAGLALTGTGAAIIVGLSVLLLPQAARAFPVAAFLPDLCLGLIFVFSVALFASTVSGSAIAAMVVALLLGGLLVLGMGFVWMGLAGPLLGYHPLLDLALWGLAFAAALLCASALVVSRGELLQSRRRHLLAFPALLAGLLVSVFLVSAVARWATRYQRDRVEVVLPLHATPGSPVLMLSTQADPVPLERGADTKGWSRRATGRETNEVGNSSRGPLYRSAYYVAIDLHSGRELFTLRQPASPDPQGVACSKDGRFAAVTTVPGSITWGQPEELYPRPSRLHVYDLQRGTRLFAGTPETAGVKVEHIDSWPQWSGSGRYLAFHASSRSIEGRNPGSLWIMHPDGTGLRDLHIWAPYPFLHRPWVWSPTEDVLYAYDDEEQLCRVPIDGQKPEVVWSLNDPAVRKTYVLALEPSPDGRWLALALSREIAGDPEGIIRITTVHAIPTSGGQGRAIATFTPHPIHPSRICNTQLAWVAEGRSLFILAGFFDGDNSHLLRWHPGESISEPTDTKLTYPARLVAIPESAEALVYPGDGDHAPLLLNEDGGLRPVLSAEFAREHSWFIGFDDTGRILTRGWRNDRPAVFASDLHTGRSQQLYP